jgi:hypothetical protein
MQATTSAWDSDLASDLVQAISKLGTAVWDNVKENPKSAIAGFLSCVFDHLGLGAVGGVF